MGAKIHVFFLKLIGKGDVLKTTTAAPTTTTTASSFDGGWVPEALTIPPPETTESPNTTAQPYYLAYKIPVKSDDGTINFVDKPVDKAMAEIHEQLYRETGTLSSLVFKVDITTESPTAKATDSMKKDSPDVPLLEN